MEPQQLVLSIVLAFMIFSIALELKISDFVQVARNPKPVVAGLLAQFILLPWLTFLATLFLDLPAATEAGMLLVASCPCGSLSNFVTHFGRGNTALSVSITAVANLLALVMTPLNFTWMISRNPVTASWLTEINVDPSVIWISLVVILGIPLAIGLFCSSRFPGFALRVKKPLGRTAVSALMLFILIGLYQDRHLLTTALLYMFALVIVHNACGLGMGYGIASLCRLSVPDRRAVTLETGMQNSGLALGIIATQFDANFGMVTVASIWGMWHIVTGFGLALTWRRLSPADSAPG